MELKLQLKLYQLMVKLLDILLLKELTMVWLRLLLKIMLLLMALDIDLFVLLIILSNMSINNILICMSLLELLEMMIQIKLHLQLILH